MATSIGTLAVNVTANISGATSSFNQLQNQGGRLAQFFARFAPRINVNIGNSVSSLNAVERQAQRLQGTLSNGFSVGKAAFANILANGVTSALSAATGMVTDMYAKGKELNAQLEMAEISFGTILGNQKKAKDMLAQIQQFSLKAGMFDTPGLITASKKMLAFGFAADQVIPSLQGIAEISATLGDNAGDAREKLGGIALALGQMRGGALKLEEVNQLIERQVPVWDLLSQATGKTATELKALQSAGKLSGTGVSNVLIRQFQQKYGGTIERMSATYTGMEAQADEARVQLAARGVKPMMEEFKLGFQQQLDFLQGEGAGKLADAMGNAGRLAAIAYNEAAKKAYASVGTFGQDVGQGGFAAAAGNAMVNATPQSVITAADKVIAGMDGVNNAVNKILGWKLPGFRTGGSVGGTGTGDRIPAMLEPGEFVVRKNSVSKMGLPFLNAINEGTLRGFRKGGFVDPGARRASLESLLSDPNVQAFLYAIRKFESGDDYYKKVGGGRQADLESKDRRTLPFSWTDRRGRRRRVMSSAAGAYQFINPTWDSAAGSIGAQDFRPKTQDLAALELLRRKGALAQLLSGNLQEAVRLASKEWASLPGSSAGQNPVSFAKFLQQFREGQKKGGKSNPLYVEFTRQGEATESVKRRGKASEDRFNMGQVGFYGTGGMMGGLADFANQQAPERNYRNVFRQSYDEAALTRASTESLLKVLRNAEASGAISPSFDAKDVGTNLDFSKSQAALDRNTAALNLLTKQAAGKGAPGAGNLTAAGQQAANFAEIQNSGGAADKENSWRMRITESGSQAMVQAIQMAMNGEGGFTDILRSVGAQFANTLITQLFSAGGGPGGAAAGIGFSLISGLVTGLSGGGWKWGGKKAAGGKVKKGYTYEVNEIGKEYISMAGDGYVYPAGTSFEMKGQSGPTVVNNTFVLPNGATKESQTQVGARAAAASSRALARNR